jgi:hypothetical protein
MVIYVAKYHPGWPTHGTREPGGGGRGYACGYMGINVVIHVVIYVVIWLYMWLYDTGWFTTAPGDPGTYHVDIFWLSDLLSLTFDLSSGYHVDDTWVLHAYHVCITLFMNVSLTWLICCVCDVMVRYVSVV